MDNKFIDSSTDFGGLPLEAYLRSRTGYALRYSRIKNLIEVYEGGGTYNYGYPEVATLRWILLVTAVGSALVAPTTLGSAMRATGNQAATTLWDYLQTCVHFLAGGDTTSQDRSGWGVPTW